MKRYYLLITLIVTASIGLTSCKKEDFELLNDEEIRTYLDSKGLTAEKTGSGLYYIIDKPGAGENPDIRSTVTVHYHGYYTDGEVFQRMSQRLLHGYYTDGEVFDSSVDRGKPSEFPLRNVIEGWQEGIPLFKRGGKGVLLIPSHLAYGASPPAGIRDNAVLVFDIELFDFK